MVGGMALLAPAGVMFWASWDVLGSAVSAASSLAVMAFVLGYLDDRYHLAARWRLFFSMLAVLAVTWSQPNLRVDELTFSFLASSPIFLSAMLGGIFTTFALVGLQNAVNMADGKNGLVLGLSVLWAGFLAWSAPAGLAAPIWCLVAALAVVFVFNIRERLFLGDAGSYGLSVVIGLLAIVTYKEAKGTLPADVIALWFWLPVLDCLRLMTQRLLRGSSPFEGDRLHFHHLLANTMPWRYGLTIYLALVGVPGVIALTSHDLAPALIILTSMAYALTLVVTTPQPSTRARQETP